MSTETMMEIAWTLGVAAYFLFWPVMAVLALWMVYRFLRTGGRGW